MMTDGSLATHYDHAAPDWGKTVAALGYQAAYGNFVQASKTRIKNTSLVCDIGTGCGTFALAALQTEVRPAGLTLLDPSSNMLAHACAALENHAGTVSCHQLYLGEFQTVHRFDLVLGAHVIEHCPDPVKALRQIYALLAPGGTMLLVISRPHWCQWLIWLRWRHRWFSETAVQRMATRAGLPWATCHQFTTGPPQRTSYGYCFKRSVEGT